MQRRLFALLLAVAVAGCADDDAAVDDAVVDDAIAVPEPTEGSEPDDGPGTDPFTPGASIETVPIPSVATTPPPTASTSTTSSTTNPATTTTSTISSTISSTSPTSTPTTTVAPAPTPQPAPADGSPCPPTGAQVWVNRPASTLTAPALPDGWRTDSAGTSAAGRDLALLVKEVDAPARTVVVIGGIHGNEPASPPSVRAMVAASIPDDTEVWLLPTLNPDGSAAGTRCNADGVDLNRNFGFDWRASDGGPAPFSEPEPVVARALIERVDPDVVVWVHQPLDYVSSIGDTPDSYEQAWSAASGLPVRPDVTQHGGGETWTALSAGIPAMLIEMKGWDASQEMIDAQVRGFDALLDVVVPR